MIHDHIIHYSLKEQPVFWKKPKTNLGKSGNREIYTKKARDPHGQRAFKNVQKNHWKI